MYCTPVFFCGYLIFAFERFSHFADFYFRWFKIALRFNEELTRPIILVLCYSHTYIYIPMKYWHIQQWAYHVHNDKAWIVVCVTHLTLFDLVNFSVYIEGSIAFLKVTSISGLLGPVIFEDRRPTAKTMKIRWPRKKTGIH